MKILIAAAAAVSALAMAGTASAQVYGTIGYTYYDGSSINLGGPTARVGWKSATPLGLELEGGIGTDKDTTSKGAAATRVQLRSQWAGYVTATGKVGETFEASARFGYGSMSLKQTNAATFTGSPFSDTQDFNSWNYGVSGQWIYDGVNGLRIDYTRENFTKKGIPDNNVYSIAWVHKFGVMGK